MSAVPGVPGRHRESKARASHGTARMERRRLRPATVRCRRTQSPPRLARAPQEHPPQVRRRLNWPVVLTGRMHLADDQRPASVTSETFAVRLASKRVVSFNGEVFGLPHNLHRVDGGRVDTSIFRLARDHRGEAPNPGNATRTALVAMIAARMLALRSKRTCLPQLGFTLAFPSQKTSNEKAGWPIADLELSRTRLAQSEGSDAIPCPARVSGLGGYGSRGNEDRRVRDTERH